MRRNRCEDDTTALRHHQRPADREVICCTARRRSDHQSVRMIGVQQFAVHLGLNSQHVRQTLLEDRNLIQRIRRHDQSLAHNTILVYDAQIQQTALFNRILTGYQLIKNCIQIISLYFGQESQMTAVHTQDRNVFVSDSSSARQERTITSYRKRKINRLAVDILRLLLSIPILRETRILTQVQFLPQFLRQHHVHAALCHELQYMPHLCQGVRF